MVLAVKLKVCPVQSGELLEGTTGTGVGLITTVTVPIGPTQPDTDALTEYTPAASVVVAAIVGF